ncbi:hypothetical protein [Nonomuraea rubra]|uniref:hypothetical protein n=1 Tax=Nonomuraea rubra TaxID=46180 RepID=UPI0031EADF9A
MPKRPVMLACNTVSAVAFASVPVAAWLGGLTMAHLLVVAAVGGVAKVFFSLAYRAYLPVLVGSERLLEANTKLQGSESAAQLAGPGLAGLLAHSLRRGQRRARRRAQLRGRRALPALRTYARGRPPARPRRSGGCSRRSATGYGSSSPTRTCARSPSSARCPTSR